MKKKLFLTIKILISCFLLWFLTHTSQLNFNLLQEIIKSPLLLCFVIALYFIVIAISSWRWHQLNKVQNIHLPYSRTLLPTYLGVAFNNLLPGGVGGDFFRFYFLNKKVAVQKSVVMLSILFDRIIGLFGIFIAVCIIAAFYIQEFVKDKLILYFVLSSLFACFSVVIIYFLSLLLPKKTGISLRFNQKFQNKPWLNSFNSLLHALQIYRNSKLVIAKCLIASVMIQLLLALTCICLAKMMYFPSVALSDYVLALAVTQIANLLPIAPGGFGVGEMAFANVLNLINPHTIATFATIFLAYRIIGIFIYLPGVLVLFFNKELLRQQEISEMSKVAY